ncbi:hypothetical protein Ancab_002159, partial [Ancistrocladus abbreviatus]
RISNSKEEAKKQEEEEENPQFHTSSCYHDVDKAISYKDYEKLVSILAEGDALTDSSTPISLHPYEELASHAVELLLVWCY